MQGSMTQGLGYVIPFPTHGRLVHLRGEPGEAYRHVDDTIALTVLRRVRTLEDHLT